MVREDVGLLRDNALRCLSLGLLEGHPLFGSGRLGIRLYMGDIGIYIL
jgi:hypothetical protein